MLIKKTINPFGGVFHGIPVAVISRKPQAGKLQPASFCHIFKKYSVKLKIKIF
jgi:hypothetical protein